jgi:hypothetical protein
VQFLWGEEGIWGGGKALNRALGKEAVDSQHGTGVVGSSHPCTKGCLRDFSSSYHHTCVEYSVCSIKTLLCY